MYGNKEGWMMSVVIVAVMAGLLWKFELVTVPPIARPSGQFKNLREPIALPVKPEDALPGVMTEDRDAGDLYWQAIKVYRDAPATYDKSEPKYVDRLDELKAVNLLIEATAARNATIFARKPETLVNYKYPWPELDALFKVGVVANSVAFISQARGDEEQTKKYAHACFSLGAKLYNERLTHGELDIGLKLMQAAGDSLKALAKKQGNKAEQDKWQQFGDQTRGYYESKVQKLIGKILSAGEMDVRTHSGDVFELVMNSPDRMWRVEALLKLGRYQYEKGGSRADAIWAKRLLSEPGRLGRPDLTKDPDPAVARAATIARDLTVEDFRLIQ